MVRLKSMVKMRLWTLMGGHMRQARPLVTNCCMLPCRWCLENLSSALGCTKSFGQRDLKVLGYLFTLRQQYPYLMFLTKIVNLYVGQSSDLYSFAMGVLEEETGMMIHKYTLSNLRAFSEWKGKHAPMLTVADPGDAPRGIRILSFLHRLH